MGLLQRIFGNGGNKDATRGGPPTSQFHESETTSNEDENSRNAPRRELVQVILRDTMRKHGIPSDWIECRILSTISRSGRAGMHVNFVVRQAHEQLIGYVFAFQDSFEKELARFDPRAGDWLLSIGWEFQGHQLKDAMPDPKSWSALQAGGHPPLAPRGSRAPLADAGRSFAATDDAMALEMPKSDEDVQRDLEALFAIRDAAMADTARKPGEPDHPEFEQTQPFADSDPTEQRAARR
jgi:hypothetical protein